MADAVTTNVLFSGKRLHAARFTNLSDGTGESAVAKITASGLNIADGVGGTKPATKLTIMEIQWNIYGFSEVRLFWDATTDDLAQTLSGNGYRSYWDQGGLVDPWSTGHTGNLLFTTVTNVSGNHYDITVVVKPE